MKQSEREQFSRDPAVFFAQRTFSPTDQSTVIMAHGANSGPRTGASQLESAGDATTSLASYFEVLFVYKRLLLGCVLASTILGWITIVFLPRSYESEAKLMIRVGRESVALDPTATTGQTLMLQKTQEEEIVSALEVLGSRQVCAAVVDELGQGPILSGNMPSEGDSSAGGSPIGWVKERASDAAGMLLVIAGLRDTISDREMAVRKVQNSVEIHAQKKSNVISILAHSKTPEMAQELVKTTCDAFVEQHLRTSQTAGSQDFFTQEVAAARKHLNALADTKAAFMKGRGIVSIDASRKLLQDQLADCEREHLLASSSKQQVLAEIEDLRAKIGNADEEIVAGRKEGSDSTWSGMRQRVYELELQEKSFAAKYTDKHQKLLDTREQLNGARVILAKLQSERVDQSMTPNPMKRRMEDDLQQSQTKIVGLQSVIEEKERQRDLIATQVQQLHDWEIQMTQMDRELASGGNSLQLLVEKLEEARVIAELRNNQISNVSVFQPATFVERPASPRKRILAAGFLMLGLFGGLGLALIKEIGSDTMRTPAHVESCLNYPVVSTVPRNQRIAAGDSLRLSGIDSLREQCESIIAELMLSRTRVLTSSTRGRSLGVIGIEPGCGASTLAAALAKVSSDHCGLKTMLIDADVKARSVSKAFGMQGAPGLLELSNGDAEPEDCVLQLQDSELKLIPYALSSHDGRQTCDPRSSRLRIQEFQETNDLVIVDLPPATQPGQALSLAQNLDFVLVLIESEGTNVAMAKRFLNRFSGSDTEVLGVVLNKTRDYVPAFIKNIVT